MLFGVFFCQDGCNPGSDSGEGLSCLPHPMPSFFPYRGRWAVQTSNSQGRKLLGPSLGCMKDPWSKPTPVGFTVVIFSPLFSFYIPSFVGIAVTKPTVALRFLVKDFSYPLLRTKSVGVRPASYMLLYFLLQHHTPSAEAAWKEKKKKNLKWFYFLPAFLLICTINQDKSLLVLSVCGHINTHLWLPLILTSLKYWQKYMSWEYLSQNCNLVESF